MEPSGLTRRSADMPRNIVDKAALCASLLCPVATRSAAVVIKGLAVYTNSALVLVRRLRYEIR